MMSVRLNVCVLLLVCLSVPGRMARLHGPGGVIQGGRERQIGSAFKRLSALDAGNPCPDPEKPFPCKSTKTCIPMGYLCDDNEDCEDGYDENREVCTAAHRPPVGDILTFLESEKGWIIPGLFGRANIRQVAHGLAVSPTVDNLAQRLGLGPDETMSLRAALEAVRDGDESMLTHLGMPPSAWTEVSFVFSKLIKSGFLNTA